MATDEEDEFVKQVTRRAERRSRRRKRGSTVWFGVSTFGIVGWSIAVPTLLGLGLGIWLDRRLQSDFSWTVALLLGGITLGCLNAWHWVSEQQIVDREDEQ